MLFGSICIFIPHVVWDYLYLYNSCCLSLPVSLSLMLFGSTSIYNSCCLCLHVSLYLMLFGPTYIFITDVVWDYLYLDNSCWLGLPVCKLKFGSLPGWKLYVQDTSCLTEKNKKASLLNLPNQIVQKNYVKSCWEMSLHPGKFFCIFGSW